jgi:hypothetical protein
MKQSVTKLLSTFAQNVNPVTLHFFASIHSPYFGLRSQRSVTTQYKLSAFFGNTHICERLFSEMDTAKQRTEIDPPMKDHGAVFALQLLIYFPVSICVTNSSVNFLSEVLFSWTEVKSE